MSSGSTSDSDSNFYKNDVSKKSKLMDSQNCITNLSILNTEFTNSSNSNDDLSKSDNNDQSILDQKKERTERFKKDKDKEFPEWATDEKALIRQYADALNMKYDVFFLFLDRAKRLNTTTRDLTNILENALPQSYTKNQVKHILLMLDLPFLSNKRVEMIVKRSYFGLDQNEEEEWRYYYERRKRKRVVSPNPTSNLKLIQKMSNIVDDFGFKDIKESSQIEIPENKMIEEKLISNQTIQSNIQNNLEFNTKAIIDNIIPHGCIKINNLIFRLPNHDNNMELNLDNNIYIKPDEIFGPYILLYNLNDGALLLPNSGNNDCVPVIPGYSYATVRFAQNHLIHAGHFEFHPFPFYPSFESQGETKKIKLKGEFKEEIHDIPTIDSNISSNIRETNTSFGRFITEKRNKKFKEIIKDWNALSSEEKEKYNYK